MTILVSIIMITVGPVLNAWLRFADFAYIANLMIASAAAATYSVLLLDL